MPVAVAEGNGLRLGVLSARDEGEGDLLLCRIADFLAETVVGQIDVDPDSRGSELGRDFLAVGVEGFRNGDEPRLDRGEPGGEGSCVVLGEDADETFDRPEFRGVDHDRPSPRTVGGGVFQIETLGLVEVVLHRRHLPCAAQRVLDLHGDLWPVKGGPARVGNEVEPGGRTGFLEDAGRSRPIFVRADEFVLLLPLVAGGELEVEVRQPEIAQNVQEETEKHLYFPLGLLRSAVRMRIVLGEATHAGESVDHSRLLIAVVAAHLEEAQRQLPIRTSAGAENEIVHGAVHGLEVVVLARPRRFAVGAALLVDLHGREHRVRIVRKMARRVEEPAL